MHTAVKDIDVAEKLIDEGRGRIRIDFVRGADLLDASTVHHHHAVSDLQRFFLIVGHKDARNVHLVVQASQPATKFLAHPGVKRSKGLVEQQYPGLYRQSARQRDSLTLTTGKLRGVAIGQPVELDELEQVIDPLADLGR